MLFHMCSLKSKSSRVMKCIQVSLSEHSGGFREGTKRRGTGQSNVKTVIHAASSCYKGRPLSSPFTHAAAADSVEILLIILLPNNCTKNPSRQATACPPESSSEARLAPGRRKSTSRLAHEQTESLVCLPGTPESL
jgi:hypothetical protein